MKGYARVIVAALLGSALASTVAARPIPERSWQHYYAVKTVIQSMLYARESRRPHEAQPTLDLYDCDAGTDYLGQGGPSVTGEFADVAFDIASWRQELTRAKYPASLWRPVLVAYEKRQVDRAIALARPEPFGIVTLSDDQDPGARSIAGLVPLLDTYRAAHPALPKVVERGGCGGVGASVSITTSPPASVVMFIPTFFYELCRVQKENADDPDACPQWREAVAGKLQSVAGDYRYFVRWRDGAVRRGKLSFGVDDDGHTITLAKP